MYVLPVQTHFLRHVSDRPSGTGTLFSGHRPDRGMDRIGCVRRSTPDGGSPRLRAQFQDRSMNNTNPSEEDVPHHIAGRRFGAANPRQAVYNPALGTVVRHVLLGGPVEADAAVAAARTAFPAWADTPPIRRGAS